MQFPRTVYMIQHNVTKRIYVGSTWRSIEKRYKGHIRDLKFGRHSSRLMQKDYDLYGEDYIICELDKIKDFSERTKEYDWMEELDTYDPRYGYNQGDYKKKFKRDVLSMSQEELEKEFV